ncbi:MAG: hypothetical protein KA988_03495 [Longilinea sp.]|nr:hypothetical protein [Longilinea sp.]MCA1954031.1 hypothetical protein [Anaerolinea sp.]
MKSYRLWIWVFVVALLAGCTNTPTLDINSLQTAAAQTAIVIATQAQFETQVAGLTQATPTSAPISTTPQITVLAPPTAVLPSPAVSTPVTPSATAPAEPRPGGDYAAPRLTAPPKLDGVWDEWETPAFAIRSLVYNRTASTWEGDNDLEGSFRIGWDATNLYLAVKANDDIFSQKATGKDLFKGDSIELLLDTDLNGDYSVPLLNSDDYQLGMSPGVLPAGTGREAYLWYPQNVAGTRTQVTLASVGGDGAWRIEAAIPWSVFGITPSAGMKFGFAVSISDCDDRDAACQDSMVSTAPKRNFSNPTTWGTLTLQP